MNVSFDGKLKIGRKPMLVVSEAFSGPPEGDTRWIAGYAKSHHTDTFSQ